MLFLLQMSFHLNVCKLELNTGYADQKKDSLTTQFYPQQFQFHTLCPKHFELKKHGSKLTPTRQWKKYVAFLLVNKCRKPIMIWSELNRRMHNGHKQHL